MASCDGVAAIAPRQPLSKEVAQPDPTWWGRLNGAGWAAPDLGEWAGAGWPADQRRWFGSKEATAWTGNHLTWSWHQAAPCMYPQTCAVLTRTVRLFTNRPNQRVMPPVRLVHTTDTGQTTALINATEPIFQRIECAMSRRALVFY